MVDQVAGEIGVFEGIGLGGGEGEQGGGNEEREGFHGCFDLCTFDCVIPNSDSINSDCYTGKNYTRTQVLKSTFCAQDLL